MKKKYYKKPYRIKRKKSIFKNRFFWISILILMIVGGLFYFFVFSDFFQVKKIIITGEEKTSTNELKSLIEKKLENKIFFTPTKSIFLVDLKEIKKEISNSFPQIAEIEIKKGLTDSISIVVIERIGLVNFCQQEKCFLLDNEGVIFEEALMETNLTKITDNRKTEPLILGKKVIEKDIILKILNIEFKLKDDLKISLKELTIVSEERLNVKTSDIRALAKSEDERSSSTTRALAKSEDERSSSTGWEIYFNLKGDLNWQILKLKAVLENRIPPEKRGNINYIDLRFERVYILPETYNQ